VGGDEVGGGVAGGTGELVEAEGGQQRQEEEDAGVAGVPALAGGQGQDADIGGVGAVGLGGWGRGYRRGSSAGVGSEKGGGVPLAQS
jgi:hypothetical protein